MTKNQIVAIEWGMLDGLRFGLGRIDFPKKKWYHCTMRCVADGKYIFGIREYDAWGNLRQNASEENHNET